MRYPAEHRDRVRDRIVHKAGELFRQRGYAAVGIDAIMDAAQLTRGGFYGYFESKLALFREVLLLTPELVFMLRQARGSHPRAPRAATKHVISRYLSNDLGAFDRCSLAALTGEVAHLDPDIADAFAMHLEEHFEELSRHVQGKRGASARRVVLSVSALMAGGLSLSKAVGDDALATELLAACRQTALDLLQSS